MSNIVEQGTTGVLEPDFKERAPTKETGTISLRWSVVLSIVITAIMVVLTVQLPLFFFFNRRTDRLLEQLNNGIIASVSRETDQLFGKTLSVEQTVHELFDQEVVSPFEKGQREELYLRLLKNNEEFSWISFGWPNGDFFGAQRVDPKLLRVVDSIWDPDIEQANRIIDSYIVNDDNTLTSGERSFVTQVYYAPQRSWYREAQGVDKHIFTDVYVFNTSRKPGINSAIRLLSDNGELIGVISIAIELERISVFLRNLNISESGVTFVIDANQQLVAFPDIEEVTYSTSDTGELNLRPLEFTENPLLRIVYNAFSTNNVVLADTENFSRVQLTTTNDGQRYFVVLDRLQGAQELEDLGWYVGAIVPERDLLGNVRRSIFILISIVIAAIIIELIVILILAQYVIIRPIQQIVQQAEYIRTFDLEKVQLPRSPISEVFSLSASMTRMKNGLTAFRKYVPAELVRSLVGQGREAQIGGEEQTLSVFFSDISGFTHISETLGDLIFWHLANYFRQMSQAIHVEQGTIDKYVGDAIMAFWNAPLSQSDHAMRSCRAALRCQRMLQKLRDIWRQKNQHLFYCRIGINTGKALVGNVGWEQRMDYTVIGDAVNIASRLEGMNKVYGTSIIIGSQTYAAVKDRMICRHLDRVVLAGKQRPEEIYELVAARSGRDSGFQRYQWVEHFENGLKEYRARRWAQAEDLFKAAGEKHPTSDNPSTVFIKRCQFLSQHRVPDDWNGVFVARVK